MDIRTITFGIENSFNEFNKIRNLMRNITDYAKSNGNSITTSRIVGEPFYVKKNLEQSISIFDKFEDLREQTGANWYCIPYKFDNDIEITELTDFIHFAMSKYENAFINFIVDMEQGQNSTLLKQAGKIIKKISLVDSDGFANFRFAFSMNVKPYTPFFPASYHNGNTGFSVSYELVPEFIKIIRECKNVSAEKLKETLISGITALARSDMKFFEESGNGIKFYGADYSLAPMSALNLSVITLLNELKTNHFPTMRNMFLTQYLTSVLKSIASETNHSIGFNGVFYSVLEDSLLGEINLNTGINIDTLLAYSTMCGCGLDMIPVPGDVDENILNGLLCEVYAISLKLNKPLICRILPIPGKKADDLTDFHHDFFANTSIMNV